MVEPILDIEAALPWRGRIVPYQLPLGTSLVGEQRGLRNQSLLQFLYAIARLAGRGIKLNAVLRVQLKGERIVRHSYLESLPQLMHGFNLLELIM